MALAKAYAAAGITEIQVNNGWQPNATYPSFEKDMVNLTGWYHGAEWCAAAAILIWKKAYMGNVTILGLINKLVSLNSQEMANNFHADPVWPTSSSLPKIGSIVVWAMGDSRTMGHTGIVVAISPDGKSFNSVEGNTSSPSAPDTREGWTMAIHTHVLGQPHSSLHLNVDRFIYPLESYSPLEISE